MKRLRVILLFLLLGAIVNVAVAWGSLALSDLGGHGTRGSSGLEIVGEEYWSLHRIEVFGTERITSTRIHHDFSSSERQAAVGKPSPSQFVPSWTPLHSPTVEYVQARNLGARDVQESLCFEASGWPLRALWCFRLGQVFWDDGSVDLPLKGFIETSLEDSRFVLLKALPFLPIWRGLLLNTIFYSSILWLLIPGPFVLRRFIRRKRGLCVRCAYDLRGAEHEACPECGTDVKKIAPA